MISLCDVPRHLRTKIVYLTGMIDIFSYFRQINAVNIMIRIN